jgi:two-component system sensor histidine kinase TctE
VDDTGPGIPLAQRQAVFERFYRGTQEGLGCGLGLPIVKEIIERHAGSVTLLDRPPHGLRVRLRLPLAARV